jgi:hypothetical protein
LYVSVLCDHSVGVSFSGIAVRKAGPDSENSFADGDAEFVCPNEFAQQATSRQKDIRFIMPTCATPSLRHERINRIGASDTSDILLIMPFKVSHGPARMIPARSAFEL